MPSILGHAFVGATAARLAHKKGTYRRLLIISLVCSVIADFDVITFPLGISYDSFLGHRGFSHSILFSILVGGAATGVFLRTLHLMNRTSLLWGTYFFFVTLSHPILDAMTTGGHGVAFFSPVDLHRYFFNYRTIYVSPLFISGIFNYLGIRIIFKEIICILLPCLVFIAFQKVALKNFSKKLNQAILVTAPILVLVLILFSGFGLVREELISGINGVDVHSVELATYFRPNPDSNKDTGYGIPLDLLPGKRLVTNYNELLTRGLLNSPLIPKNIPWASSSFPFWLGGASGRWQEPYWKQIWKVLMGESFATRSELLSLLHRSQTSGAQSGKAELAKAELRRLAPSEKYDLAVGDYHLSTTRTESILRGAGSLDAFPQAPFWSGYCSWISLASIYQKEPKHPVDVVNADGYVIQFLPEDLKVLLGVSYLFVNPKTWQLGSRCDLEGPKSEACLDINPADLVIALTHLIGIAKTSFLIDKEPFSEVQTGPIRKAEIKVINPPYFIADRRSFFPVAEGIQWLVDVEIKLSISLISAFKGSADEETLSYKAILGLDSNMNLVGGRWENPFNHPDFAWGGSSLQTEPVVENHHVLANRLDWAVIKKLVEESSVSPSSSKTQATRLLELGSMTSVPNQHGLAFQADALGVSGRVAYLRPSPAELYGYLGGKNLNQFNSIELMTLGNSKLNQSEETLAVDHFSEVSEGPQETRRFFQLRAPGSIEKVDTVVLRLNKKDKFKSNDIIQFVIPPQRKFVDLLE